MNKVFIHNAFFRLLSGTVTGVLTYLLILLVNNNLSTLETIFSNEELYVCIALSYLSFELMRLLISFFTKYKKSVDLQAHVLQTIIVVGVSLVAVGVAISFYYRLVIGFTIGQRELTFFLTIYGVANLLYNVLYFSHYYLQLENKERMEQESALLEKIDADFFSFRSELNPDLLYESLENLLLSIHHNALAAEEQIDYLASVYRYTLTNRHKELVSYQEELASAENLIALLNFRFDGAIRLYENIGTTNSFFLIPGSFLVTLDTIIRNTLISKNSPLAIRLYVEDDYLVLQHQLNDRLLVHQQSMESFKRLQRSYSFFSDTTFVQVKAGNQHYIKFPLVHVPSLVETTL